MKKLLIPALALCAAAVTNTAEAVWLRFHTEGMPTNTLCTIRYRTEDGDGWYKIQQGELDLDKMRNYYFGILDGGYSAYIFFTREVKGGVTNDTAFAGVGFTSAEAEARADRWGYLDLDTNVINRAGMRAIKREFLRFMPQLPSGTAVIVR